MRTKQSPFRPAAICRYGNAAIIVSLALYFFFIPFGQMTYYLIDPALSGKGIPQFAFDLHRRLSPKYQKWARQPALGYWKWRSWVGVVIIILIISNELAIYSLTTFTFPFNSNRT